MIKIIKTIIVAIAISMLSGCGYYKTKSTNIKIQDIITRVEGSQGNVSTYFYYDTNKGIFVNEDSLLKLKFNSMSLRFTLEKNRCYSVSYYGKRIPFLSLYPNILSVAQENCVVIDE